MSKTRIGGLRMAWLEAFIAVAEHESFAEAARAMGCDQSTVSRYIASLEIWLQRVLTNHNVPVVLTPEGEEFVETARQVISLLKTSQKELSEVVASAPKISGSGIDMSRYHPRQPSVPDGLA